VTLRQSIVLCVVVLVVYGLVVGYAIAQYFTG
jgi:hypothetical protein